MRREGHAPAQAAGRPREARIDGAIDEAVAAILAESGYAGLSIEAVARRAGVGRPTIYRRYHNKADLAISTIARLAALDASRFEGIAPRPPETGSPAGDIEELFLALASSFDALEKRGIVPSFLGDLMRDPELAGRFFREYLHVAQQPVRAVLAGAAPHAIEPAALPEVVVSMLVGAYVHHRFAIAQPFGAEERRTVAAVMATGLAGLDDQKSSMPM